MSCGGGGHIEECKHCKRLFMYSLGSVCNLIKKKALYSLSNRNPCVAIP